MEKLKGKYEIILGFVTLVVSLSAFKDELAQVNLKLGWTTVSLADYFLYAVYGFAVCLYLYVIEHIVRETKIGAWKIFDYAIWAAFILFVLILLTPLLIIINLIAVKIYSVVSKKTAEEARLFFMLFDFVLGIVGGVISHRAVALFRKGRKKKLQEEIAEREIIELDNASKLFRDGYYSHSVLETFKVLETHLFKKLLDKNIRVQRYNQKDLIQVALEQGIITPNDLPAINDIRGMRNIAAHSDAEHTKQQTQFALDFVKQLLARDGNDHQKDSAGT